MEILTERLLLRELVEADAASTNIHERDPDVVRYQTSDVRTLDESLAYIRRVQVESAQTPRHLFDLAVVLRSSSELVGRCGLKVVDSAARQAALWYVLDRAQWGHGYIPEAARALLEFGFQSLRVHRAFVDCDPRNVASSRVAEKLGMRREAHFRENAFVKGEWTDSWIYALLDREWSRLPERER
jgi:[ribosomal protein S5]-alanine N-acetyltransferase